MQDRPSKYNDRQQHQRAVQSFLQGHFPGDAWEFSLPEGTGSETFLAHNNEQAFFIKLGAQTDRYQAVASLGLTPEVLAVGSLEDGTSILVQPYVTARTPTGRDYQIHLEQFAAVIAGLHSNPGIRKVLPRAGSELYREQGLQALAHLRQKWERHKAQVPQVAGFIDESLEMLDQRVREFQGAGLVASHNDICNANWLIDPEGHLYLIDLDSMELDDPAFDIGATLWWYYPPEQRHRFLTIVGHANDRAFENRMRVRMTMHCLNICLPREHSFDRFDPAAFASQLTDFRASLAGAENPQGYGNK
jgi:thiamine kinase-like enzyme